MEDTAAEVHARVDTGAGLSRSGAGAPVFATSATGRSACRDPLRRKHFADRRVRRGPLMFGGSGHDVGRDRLAPDAGVWTERRA